MSDMGMLRQLGRLQPVPTWHELLRPPPALGVLVPEPPMLRRKLEYQLLLKAADVLLKLRRRTFKREQKPSVDRRFRSRREAKGRAGAKSHVNFRHVVLLR